MILTDLSRAIAQIGDARFLSVLIRAVLVTLVLLGALVWGLYRTLAWWAADGISLPLIGTIGMDGGLGWATLIVLALASILLMLPLALVIVSLFLDAVVDAVEERHYPGLPGVEPQPVAAALGESLRFFGVMIAVNLAALVIYFAFTILAPFVFLAVNGILIGREYYHLVAARRLGNAGARALRRRHRGEVWLTGVILALPMGIPLVNLLVPVIGVAAYTHQAHRHMGTPRVTARQ
ncbi:EI24 domain-containing protein [Oceanibium sediminis]|uniref:EI24 domain-containing protein n=1 Tax=Oceanibium sediminis TaxID=2026339 RepID=UPI000DD4A0AA|nr:EI24 domain-containing protein [Oceanibium sediminis]